MISDFRWFCNGLQFVIAFGFTYSAVGGFGIGLLRLRIIQAGVTNKTSYSANVIKNGYYVLERLLCRNPG